MPAADRRAVVALLERHGVPTIGAQALRRWGVALRERTLRTRQGLAMILRAGTGEPLGEILSGTSEQVEAGPLLRRMQPGERYVSVHTHPGGQSFSAHDAAVLVAHHQRLIVVAVVGAQGVWYVLSVNPDRAPASPGEVYDACFQEHIAPALGLRYDRA